MNETEKAMKKLDNLIEFLDSITSGIKILELEVKIVPDGIETDLGASDRGLDAVEKLLGIDRQTYEELVTRHFAPAMEGFQKEFGDMVEANKKY